MISHSTIKELLERPAGESSVTLQGWIRNKRMSKRVIFITMQDGSTQNTLQVVADPQQLAEDLIKSLQVGASLSITGKIVHSQGSAQSKEMQAESITLLGHSSSSYPLQPKHHSLAFLRSIQHLRFRTHTFGAIFRIRHAASYAIHHFLSQRGFFWLHTPILTNIDTEGAGETFEVVAPASSSHPGGFFGSTTHLTVSGQLAAESAVLGLGKVYTFGPTFRAENSNTTRHLAEFWMVEPEMAFYDLQDNIALAEELLRYTIQYVLSDCSEELAFLNRRATDEATLCRHLDEYLHDIIAHPFEQITYTEALAILMEAAAHDGTMFHYPVTPWGVTLQTEHERYLTAYFKRPVVVTDYPKEGKPFYMRQNDDGKTVAAMDILFPVIGEVVGGSQREERYDHLLAAVQAHQLDLKRVDWYLDTRRFGTVIHSGFGIGFERLLLVLTGMDNIRDVIPYPRTPGHIAY
ncbi:MAG: asparagine--tRNA ligase [Bacteroidota bacterium]